MVGRRHPQDRPPALPNRGRARTRIECRFEGDTVWLAGDDGPPAIQLAKHLDVGRLIDIYGDQDPPSGRQHGRFGVLTLDGRSRLLLGQSGGSRVGSSRPSRLERRIQGWGRHFERAGDLYPSPGVSTSSEQECSNGRRVPGPSEQKCAYQGGGKDFER
jgi:hypothetical protein